MSADQIIERLARNGRVCMRLQGSSMLPWVRPGDIAILHKVAEGEVRCGDIVVFRLDDRIFVHRIVERCTRDGRNFLVTKGDANPHPDGVIAPSEILARVERIYRGNQRIEFHSREKRALSFLIAQVSRQSGFWFALVQARRIAIGPARRLLRTFRVPRATAR